MPPEVSRCTKFPEYDGRGCFPVIGLVIPVPAEMLVFDQI
jgi:hypothetical protein